MKNKVLALAITLVMVATLVGGSNFAVKAFASSKAAGSYKVAMVLDSTISDGGWGTACYNAMVTAAKNSGFETKYTDGLATADFASTIKSYCDLGFNLIFAPGNQYQDAVKEVAAEYPNVDFAILNGSVQTKNIVSLLPDAKQIGYLAGAFAGLMTKTNQIGFIGGMEFDSTKQKLACYTAAAKAVNPKVKAYSAYAGSFNDAAKGKEIANSMVTMNKVDVMFGDASAVDSGAREALAKYKNTYDIGQPADLLKTQKSNVIIGSVVTDNAKMIQVCMNDVKKGTFGNKTVYGNLSNGALSVGTFGSSVPKAIQLKYMSIVDKIKKGVFIK